jgi:hypothetical protein
VLGYPALVGIDADGMVADEEFGWRITDFRPAP